MAHAAADTPRRSDVAATPLAINGGDPVRSAPMPARIQVDERELDAITALVRKAMVDGGAFDRYEGPEVDAYERELAAYFGVKHATCVSSGTAAIHTALGALDLEPGSEVICSAFTDPGAVMPIIWNNCVPVWADHDPETFLMSPEGIRAAITPFTRAIVVGQIHGYVADMTAIMEIAEQHGLTVIGDCSQAHGSTYQGSRSAPFGHIGAMSLMSGKHMVAGGQGGMVATDDEGVYWAAKRFADRGKPFGQQATSNTGLGLNYRMHELEAVMGRVQLTKLDAMMTSRRQSLAGIHAGIADIDVLRPVAAIDGVEINPWSALFLLDLDQITVDNATFAAAVSAEGVPLQHSYHAAMVFDLDFMRNRKTYGTSSFPWGYELGGRMITWQEPHLPHARDLSRRLLLLPMHECWTDREVDDTVAAFRKVAAAYQR